MPSTTNGEVSVWVGAIVNGSVDDTPAVFARTTTPFDSNKCISSVTV